MGHHSMSHLITWSCFSTFLISLQFIERVDVHPSSFLPCLSLAFSGHTTSASTVALRPQDLIWTLSFRSQPPLLSCCSKSLFAGFVSYDDFVAVMLVCPLSSLTAIIREWGGSGGRVKCFRFKSILDDPFKNKACTAWINSEYQLLCFTVP